MSNYERALELEIEELSGLNSLIRGDRKLKKKVKEALKGLKKEKKVYMSKISHLSDNYLTKREKALEAFDRHHATYKANYNSSFLSYDNETYYNRCKAFIDYYVLRKEITEYKIKKEFIEKQMQKLEELLK